MHVRSLSARYFATPDALRRAVLARAGTDGSEEVAPEDAPETPPLASEEETGEAPVIVYEDGGFNVETEDGTAAATTRLEALAYLETTDWFAAALERKRKPEGLAAPRWFDAAAVEDIPSARDESQVREDMIDQMVRNLAREKTPITIDGGGVSEVHSSVWDSGVAAAGYAYVAVKLIDEEDRAHLYLYGSCLREVDARIDAKQLQWGSIAFVADDTDRYSGEPIGARLISYALTNQPFIDGLEPHASRSSAPASGRRLAITRSRQTMPTVHTRKPRVRTEASAPNPLPPAPAPEPAPPPAPEPAPAPEPEAAAAKALEGLDDPAATEAYVNDIVAQMRRLTGMTDAAPATLLEMLKGLEDGALSAAAPVEENAEPSGEPVAASAAEGEGTRSRDDESRSEVIGLRSAFKTMQAELATLRAKEHGRAIEAKIDERFGAAKIAPPQGDDRAELVEMCRARGNDWQKPIEFALRAVNKPPQGLRTAPNAETVQRSAAGESALSFTDAHKQLRAELTRANPKPGEKGHRSRNELDRAAYVLVSERFPDIAKRAALGDGAL